MSSTTLRLVEGGTRLAMGENTAEAVRQASLAKAAADRAEAASRIPSPPPGPLSVGSVTDMATPGIPTDGSDAAPAINAALASSGTVVLETDANYALGSAIIRPSYSRLLARDGAPARIYPLPGFSGGAGNLYNALVTNEPGAHDLTIRNIMVDGVGLGFGDVATRINGFKELAARRVRHELTVSKDCSGYGHFTQQNGSVDTRDIFYDRSGTLGCEYGFEQMRSDGVYGLDCWAEDSVGGPVPVAAWIHPVTGSRNIVFVRFKGRGAANAGISILHNEARLQENIQLIDCEFDVTTGKAISSEGNGRTEGLLLAGGRFRGAQANVLSGIVARLIGQGSIEAVSPGTVAALNMFGAYLEVGHGSRIFVRTTADGSVGFGLSIDATSTLRISGSIEGDTPTFYPVSGEGLPNIVWDRDRATVSPTPADVTAAVVDIDPAHIATPLRFTDPGAQTYRVLADNINLTFPLDTVIRLKRLGGPVTVAADAGVTLVAPAGLTIDTLPGAAVLTKVAGVSTWAVAIEGVVSEGTPPPPPATAPTLGNSVPLQSYGTGVTLSALDGDGFYTVTTDSSGESRAVGSSSSLTGDILVEIVPLADPPNMSIGFDDEAAFAFRDYLELLEAVQTEGGGGGPNYLGVFKSGAAITTRTRDGNIYMSRVGSGWFIYTGVDWGTAYAAGPIYEDTAVNTDARFLSIITIGNGANFKVRYVTL